MVPCITFLPKSLLTTKEIEFKHFKIKLFRHATRRLVFLEPFDVLSDVLQHFSTKTLSQRSTRILSRSDRKFNISY